MPQSDWRLEPCSNAGAILVRGGNTREDWHPQSHLQIVPIEDARLMVEAPEMRALLEDSLLLYESDCLTYGADSSCGTCIPCKVRVLLARIEGGTT